MKLVCWSTLLLCVFANADNNAVWREAGQDVTLKCSSTGCPSSDGEYDGMYLYYSRDQDHKEQKEVLYHHPYPNSTSKITPRKTYSGRIETKGPLSNHTITISNLTVDDSGFYSCVYMKAAGDVRCSAYTLFISGVAPCPTSAPEVPSVLVIEKLMVLIIMAACTVSTLVTVIFILLIVPRVKRWARSSRRRTTSVAQVSLNDVYEVMSKNGFQPTQE
ncbi:uncharacterized protein si:ch211-188c18.1 [Etheostoma cragini]|uniref:uncharacterized protein si:ch211-188c18.1 n=1 Tax=Etheostoma cragini TaxID=417921 RepID=UPI00155F2B4D|nr:uncharacterized protein si:ch211-188c18.1 [Etheostoma cragini]